jgi:hypothetical protein
MSKYVVHYEMRKDNLVSHGSKTVECETERTAIKMVESQVKPTKPGYDFILKKVEQK